MQHINYLQVYKFAQVVELEALAQVRERAAGTKPRQLFKDLIKLVPSDDNEVVSIQHTHFAGQMRRERRKTSCLPGKDPKNWTDLKANLPAELAETLGGEEFARW